MRLIDADALSERLYELYKDSVRDGRVREARWDAIKALDAQPTIEAEPVRHGRWISFLDGDHIMPERYYRCSECGRIERRKEPYCHCGAKMDGDKNEPIPEKSV